jgi:Mn-dependent DtxR family transcriptional regulator
LHIYLTQQGREYAEKVYHRHCVITTFLVLHGVDKSDAEDDACEFEHTVSDATFAMMENWVEANK